MPKYSIPLMVLSTVDLTVTLTVLCLRSKSCQLVPTGYASSSPPISKCSYLQQIVKKPTILGPLAKWVKMLTGIIKFYEDLLSDNTVIKMCSVNSRHPYIYLSLYYITTYSFTVNSQWILSPDLIFKLSLVFYKATGLHLANIV